MRKLGTGIVWTGILSADAWALAAIALHPSLPRGLAWALCLMCVTGLFAWIRLAPRSRTLAGLFAFFLATRLAWAGLSPSNDRSWTPLHARTARAQFQGDRLVIQNLRNVHWVTGERFDLRWESRTYRLDEVQSVDFIVVPFAWGRALAHTFLTFGFKDGGQLAISMEIRREEGETFSPIKGLFRHYESLYVVGTEPDLIGLRVAVYGDPVYLFPTRATPTEARDLLVAMLQSGNRLADQPRFYNTLLNTCHVAVLQHVNLLRSRPIGFDWRNVLPGYSDELAWELDLIDHPGPLAEARRQCLINEKVRPELGEKAWSRQIRSQP